MNGVFWFDDEQVREDCVPASGLKGVSPCVDECRVVGQDGDSSS